MAKNGNGNGNGNGLKNRLGFTPMPATGERSPSADRMASHMRNSGGHKAGNKNGQRKSERVKTMRGVAVATGGLEG